MRTKRWSNILNAAIERSTYNNVRLAQRMGVSYQYLSAMRNGRNVPSDKTLSELIKCLQDDEVMSDGDLYRLFKSLFEHIVVCRYPGCHRINRAAVRRVRAENPHINHLDLVVDAGKDIQSELIESISFLPTDVAQDLKRFLDLLINAEKKEIVQALDAFEMMLKSLK